MPDVILQHVGILGMKWGHRKAGSGEHSGPGSEDHRVAQTIRKKHVKDMSNDELRKVTTRMSLEKQYKDLRTSDVTKGRKIVSDILTSSGKSLASEVITKSAKIGALRLAKVLETRRLAKDKNG